MTTIYPGTEAARYAYARIRSLIRETPLNPYHNLWEDDSEVWLKLENHQFTGSFKARGALNKMLTLSDAEQGAGIVSASSGNHGLGVAYAASKLGITATIFVPDGIEPSKLHDLNYYDLEIQQVGKDCGETEAIARETAEKTGRIYVSPYNDPEVIAGQGTIGVELEKQLSDIDTVIVAVGGGGLISGIGGYLKGIRPEIKIVGASPANSPALFDEVMGTDPEHRVNATTISDGTGGSIEAGSVTIDLARAIVDEWILVEEKEILQAMRDLFENCRQVTEGAGAVALAGYLKERKRFMGERTVCVVCGGNIEMETFKKICLGKLSVRS